VVLDEDAAERLQCHLCTWWTGRGNITELWTTKMAIGEYLRNLVESMACRLKKVIARDGAFCSISILINI
jgi:hypothetical protein